MLSSLSEEDRILFAKIDEAAGKRDKWGNPNFDELLKTLKAMMETTQSEIEGEKQRELASRQDYRSKSSTKDVKLTLLALSVL